MRVLLLLFLCFWCICIHAQFRLGIQAGYSRFKWASINATPSAFPDSYTTSELSGFQTGLVAEVKLSDKLFLRPALFVSGKGTTLNRQSSFDTSSRRIWIGYIEVPVTLVYQGRLSSKIIGFAGGGFYAAHAFRGLEKGESKSLSGESLIYNKVEFGTHNDGPAFQILPTIVKPFDYGFTVLAGMELKSVQLLLIYSQGLKTLLPNGKPYNGNYINSGLIVSAAYLIN
ncbi:MAG TPA: outer membrane beta-barrel protein, partial [Chitinophagaceae bacterium]|nr:outer membrane beta-barrel protein [Chitinophagaceae bacterium]